jgi:two-component system sensor histidine kinase YesM
MKENSVFKYLTNYKTQSVVFKNFLVILLIIIMPMLLLFFSVYTNYANVTTKKLDDIYNQRLSNISTVFDNIYAETKLFTYSIASNPAVIDFMGEKDMNKLYSKADYEQIMGTSYITYRYIESIYLYSNVNRYILSGGKNDTVENFQDKSWLSNYASLRLNELAIIPRKINDSYPYCLSFVLAVHNDLGETIGAVVVNLNIENLLHIVAGETSGTDLYVLNAYHRLVLSNDTDKMFDQFNQYAYIYDRTHNTRKNNNSSYTISSHSSGLEYVLITNMQSDVSVFRSILIICALILFTIIIMLFVSIYLALRTFKPIQNIIEAIDKNFDSEKTLGVDNEISYIIENINATIQDKRLVEIELEERIALLNNAYTVALQAQINPHFLYNTLETINFMAYKHFRAANDISDITVSLSKMLRIGLDGENKIVPLKTEKEHLSLYIRIMELRYPNKCDFIFNIPDELENCKVIKLILQPLVENAFQHGIRPACRRGTVTISAFTCGNKLIFTVADDGMGMDLQTLHSVQEILASDIYLSSKHIGINNVNRRIKILFGTEYGLSVDSAPGKGTTFTITMPLSYF